MCQTSRTRIAVTRRPGRAVSMQAKSWPAIRRSTWAQVQPAGSMRVSMKAPMACAPPLQPRPPNTVTSYAVSSTDSGPPQPCLARPTFSSIVREVPTPSQSCVTSSTMRVPSRVPRGTRREKVNVPLEQILELNPDLDPQTLTPGTKLKLR